MAIRNPLIDDISKDIWHARESDAIYNKGNNQSTALQPQLYYEQVNVIGNLSEACAHVHDYMMNGLRNIPVSVGRPPDSEQGADDKDLVYKRELNISGLRLASWSRDGRPNTFLSIRYPEGQTALFPEGIPEHLLFEHTISRLIFWSKGNEKIIRIVHVSNLACEHEYVDYAYIGGSGCNEIDFTRSVRCRATSPNDPSTYTQTYAIYRVGDSGQIAYSGGVYDPSSYRHPLLATIAMRSQRNGLSPTETGIYNLNNLQFALAIPKFLNQTIRSIPLPDIEVSLRNQEVSFAPQ